MSCFAFFAVVAAIFMAGRDAVRPSVQDFNFDEHVVHRREPYRESWPRVASSMVAESATVATERKFMGNSSSLALLRSDLRSSCTNGSWVCIEQMKKHAQSVSNLAYKTWSTTFGAIRAISSARYDWQRNLLGGTVAAGACQCGVPAPPPAPPPAACNQLPVHAFLISQVELCGEIRIPTAWPWMRVFVAVQGISSWSGSENVPGFRALSASVSCSLVFRFPPVGIHVTFTGTLSLSSDRAPNAGVLWSSFYESTWRTQLRLASQQSTDEAMYAELTKKTQETLKVLDPTFGGGGGDWDIEANAQWSLQMALKVIRLRESLGWKVQSTIRGNGELLKKVLAEGLSECTEKCEYGNYVNTLPNEKVVELARNNAFWGIIDKIAPDKHVEYFKTKSVVDFVSNLFKFKLVRISMEDQLTDRIAVIKMMTRLLHTMQLEILRTMKDVIEDIVRGLFSPEADFVLASFDCRDMKETAPVKLDRGTALKEDNEPTNKVYDPSMTTLTTLLNVTPLGTDIMGDLTETTHGKLLCALMENSGEDVKVKDGYYNGSELLFRSGGEGLGILINKFDWVDVGGQEALIPAAVYVAFPRFFEEMYGQAVGAAKLIAQLPNASKWTDTQVYDSARLVLLKFVELSNQFQHSQAVAVDWMRQSTQEMIDVQNIATVPECQKANSFRWSQRAEKCLRGWLLDFYNKEEVHKQTMESIVAAYNEKESIPFEFTWEGQLEFAISVHKMTNPIVRLLEYLGLRSASSGGPLQDGFGFCTPDQSTLQYSTMVGIGQTVHVGYRPVEGVTANKSDVFVNRGWRMSFFAWDNLGLHFMRAWQIKADANPNDVDTSLQIDVYIGVPTAPEQGDGPEVAAAYNANTQRAVMQHIAITLLPYIAKLWDLARKTFKDKSSKQKEEETNSLAGQSEDQQNNWLKQKINEIKAKLDSAGIIKFFERLTRAAPFVIIPGVSVLARNAELWAKMETLARLELIFKWENAKDPSFAASVWIINRQQWDTDIANLGGGVEFASVGVTANAYFISGLNLDLTGLLLWVANKVNPCGSEDAFSLSCGEEASITFQPGPIGVDYDDAGVVSNVPADGQAHKLGFSSGVLKQSLNNGDMIQIVEVSTQTVGVQANGVAEPIAAAVRRAEQGSEPFTVTFRVKTADAAPDITEDSRFTEAFTQAFGDMDLEGNTAGMDMSGYGVRKRTPRNR